MLTTQEYLFTCLAEEFTEVGQECSKAVRFTPTGLNPLDGTWPMQRLVNEYSQAVALIGLFNKIGLHIQIDPDAVEAKLEGFKKMTAISVERGVVEPEAMESLFG
jgi:hypothetical protein